MAARRQSDMNAKKSDEMRSEKLSSFIRSLLQKLTSETDSPPAGRSRGSPPPDPLGALRQPGHSAESFLSARCTARSLAAAEAAVEALPVGPKAAAEVLAALQACRSAHSLRTVVEALHAHCLDDRLFGRNFAAVCALAHNVGVEGVTMHGLVMSAVVLDYNERFSLLEASPGRFLNAAAFLSCVYGAVRIGGEPVQVLSVPLIQYLQQLLALEEPGLELFAHILARNGCALHLLHPALVQETLQQARALFMNCKSLSARGRAWLLLALDLQHARFGPLPAALYAVYQDCLGAAAMAQLPLQATTDSSAHLATGGQRPANWPWAGGDGIGSADSSISVGSNCSSWRSSGRSPAAPLTPQRRPAKLSGPPFPLKLLGTGRGRPGS